MKLTTILQLLLLIQFSTVGLFAGNAVWWEGEDFEKSDFKESDYLTEIKNPTRLSKMKWLNCYIPKDGEKTQKTFSAVYEVNVPETSEYTFWSRELFRLYASPWKYRFDDGDWVEVKKETTVQNPEVLDKNRSIVWCDNGKIQLTKGKHKLEVVISEKNNNQGFSAGFDCFLLTDQSFKPKGWFKPSVLSKYEFIGTYIWLEGEKGENNFVNKKSNLPKKNPALSDSEWLVCDFKPEEPLKEDFICKWKFTVPAKANYNIWIRKSSNNISSPFEYRFSGPEGKGDWIKTTSTEASFDKINLEGDVALTWGNYKDEKNKNPLLWEGENHLEIKVSKPNRKGTIKLGIDCICISLEPFTPQGKMKPDTEITPPKGWITFRADNSFDKDRENRMSLMNLNKKKMELCKLDSKKGLVYANGEKARFWGINVYETMKMDNNSIDIFLKKVASLGVNLIRVEGPLCNPETAQFGEIDPFLFDRLCYFIKSCRENGIYIALANYNPADYILNSKSEFKGYDKKGSPYGLLYLNPKFRDIYKKWVRFLRKRNKYTNIRLCKDPAIIWFEIQNGNGILSEAFKMIPSDQIAILEIKFNKWLRKRYGGNQEILKNWSLPQRYHPVTDNDDFNSSDQCFKLLDPETFNQKILKNNTTDFLNKRKSDQIKFLIEHYQKVNEELIEYIRNQCRYKGLISIGNSSVAAPDTLRPVMAYIQSSGDIIAKRSIFDAKVLNNAKTLSNGIFFQSRSALKNPLASPIVTPSVKGKANVTNVVSWPLPNRYRAEAAPFIAAYSSLQGADVYLWYNADSPSWATRLKKYTIQDPAIMGSFPAAALMFRRGDISPGKTVIKRKVGIEDIKELKGDGLKISKYKDQVRLFNVESVEDETNPLAFFAGKVEYIYDDTSKILKDTDLSKYYKSSKGIIESTTGELKLDFKKGYLIINTPKTQGVSGFFENDKPKILASVEVSMGNKYGSVIITSLDDQEISKSKHILIQCFNDEVNYKWKTSAVSGKKFRRLDNAGGPPIIVKEINASVSFPKIKPMGWTIWKLNINGQRLSKIVSSSDDYLEIPLQSDAFHIELIKK